MTNTVCVFHCRQLMLRSTSERRGLCQAAPAGCQKYRERSSVSADRQAFEAFLRELFDVDNMAANVDLATLVEAVHAEDNERINAQLRQVLPRADWVRLDAIGIGYDWAGVKIAVVCALTHPHLHAAVGVIVGVNQARLTLGHVERADAALMGLAPHRSVKETDRRLPMDAGLVKSCSTQGWRDAPKGLTRW